MCTWYLVPLDGLRLAVMSSVMSVRLLCVGTLISICQGTSLSNPNFAGDNFFAFQSGNNVMLSAAAVIPLGSTTYTSVVFPNTQLPAQACGDRYSRCDVTLVFDESSNKSVALLAVGMGAAVALFEREAPNLTFIGQHVIPLPAEASCTLTAFFGSGNSWFGLCYKFVGYELVTVDIYIVDLNFNSLDMSFLTLHNSDDTTFALSRAFYSFCSGFGFVNWFNDAYFSSLRVERHLSSQPVDTLDTNIVACLNNGTQQLVLYQDSTLLAYCQNVTVQVDICYDPGATTVRGTSFFCLGSENTFLEVKSESLRVSTLSNYSIPLPLNTTVPYVGHCIDINSKLFFVTTSMDGMVTLTDVLKNSVTLLATDAPVNHRVAQNRFISYSSSSCLSILDLSCPNPASPIHVTDSFFELSTFLANSNFSCSETPTTEPPTPTVTSTTIPPTQQPLLSDGAIAGITVVVIVLVCIVVGVFCCILYVLWQKKCCRKDYPSPVEESGGPRPQLLDRQHSIPEVETPLITTPLNDEAIPTDPPNNDVAIPTARPNNDVTVPTAPPSAQDSYSATSPPTSLPTLTTNPQNVFSLPTVCTSSSVSDTSGGTQPSLEGATAAHVPQSSRLELIPDTQSTDTSNSLENEVAKGKGLPTLATLEDVQSSLTASNNGYCNDGAAVYSQVSFTDEGASCQATGISQCGPPPPKWPTIFNSSTGSNQMYENADECHRLSSSEPSPTEQPVQATSATPPEEPDNDRDRYHSMSGQPQQLVSQEAGGHPTQDGSLNCTDSGLVGESVFECEQGQVGEQDTHTTVTRTNEQFNGE